MNNIIDKKNPLAFSKKEVYGDDLIDSSQIHENNNENFIDIFEYENISMEYSFKTGQTALYLKNSDYQYELLYESVINNGIQTCSLYSKDSVYILTNYNHNTGTIYSLDYIPKDIFIKFINKFDKDYKNVFFKKASDMLAVPYMLKHFTKLINDNDYYNNSSNQYLFDNYRKIFIKYTSATMLIPVSNILNNFIADVHNYIITRKFNSSIFERRLSELQNFKEVCPSSISLISSFIKNPTTTDLHQLCDSLEKNLINIDNLISLYLEDELSFKSEGERNDSK